jgi:hypothetical protein
MRLVDNRFITDGRRMAGAAHRDYTSRIRRLVPHSPEDPPMTLHDTWAAAKKQAWKEFKDAQKTT